ncbi:aldose epimerase family protein [Salinimicrobium sp. TH3]|uniref:aldose epimerase family protein n=1 Tax=Salinimicrobium sp. TH3 TaxID=2997342 RepID=UPI002273861C|nr:aldose epimerase family protein [Salinimicrobium sp. TH3]MCY2687525.1 galactose mutarotase [Salinimicrobium sp. TH3]
MKIYKLTNKNGVELKVISYGGRLTSLKVPDRNGNFENVVLNLEAPEDYLQDNPFFGALIGRYSNRIAKGEFTLDGQKYTLAQNNTENHLHGGEKGFDKVMWSVKELSASNALKLTYTSKDMEEGYPGKLDVVVMYKLNEDNSLDLEYEATTNKKTIVNLTQHSYFNLSGDFEEKVLDHRVEINADAFLPVDQSVIPTGEVRLVSNTAFDFRKPKTLGEHIMDADEQLRLASGYDHTWILNENGRGLRFAASAVQPTSGRKLEVFTTEPGMQLYTGNWLDGSLPIPKTDKKYHKMTGFCFETQHFPDSPNHSNFPSVVLEPGEIYRSKTSFRFSVE